MQFCSEGLGEMRVFNLQLRCSFATFALSADPQWTQRWCGNPNLDSLEGRLAKNQGSS